MLRLMEEYAINNYNGTISIGVIIIKGEFKKSYEYILPSMYSYNLFKKFYMRIKTHGKALNILNKFKIREEKLK